MGDIRTMPQDEFIRVLFSRCDELTGLELRTNRDAELLLRAFRELADMSSLLHKIHADCCELEDGEVMLQPMCFVELQQWVAGAGGGDVSIKNDDH